MAMKILTQHIVRCIMVLIFSPIMALVYYNPVKVPFMLALFPGVVTTAYLIYWDTILQLLQNKNIAYKWAMVLLIMGTGFISRCSIVQFKAKELRWTALILLGELCLAAIYVFRPQISRFLGINDPTESNQPPKES
jgi:hypothetical protein